MTTLRYYFGSVGCKSESELSRGIRRDLERIFFLFLYTPASTLLRSKIFKARPRAIAESDESRAIVIRGLTCDGPISVDIFVNRSYT